MALRIRRRKYVRRSKKSIKRASRRLTERKLYSFKRTCELAANNGTSNFGDNAIFDSSGRAAGNFKFALSDLPSVSDFTNLFEMYKITGVKLKFIPTQGTQANATLATSAPVLMNPLAICVDRGYTATAPTFNTLMENQDVRVMSSLKPFKVWISGPKAYSPADGLTTASMINPWIDAGQNAVHHYGLRYAFESNTGATNTTTVTFRVFATYYIKAKGVQ